MRHLGLRDTIFSLKELGVKEGNYFSLLIFALVPGSLFSIILGKYKRFVFRGRNVSARNAFRHLFSFRVRAFSALFGSLVFHCPRSFVLRVRLFLHIIYLAFIVFRRLFLVSCAWSSVQFLCLAFFSSKFFVLLAIVL